MSTNKTASWTDIILAGSDLPSDDFTWTEGSNYGLDGFHHDQTLGEGIRTRGDQSGLSGPITPAQTSGMSSLPDGLMTGETGRSADDIPEWVDESSGLDLGDMLSENEGALHLADDVKTAASLADLAWLDPTQEQDPSRLPKELTQDQAPLDSIPELEEAWGVGRRTDGLQLIPNTDKAITDYELSIQSGAPAMPGAVPGAKSAAWHIKKAIRRSHYGHSISEIHRELQAALGEGPLFTRAFAHIQADHGVAGRVYIQASAFPGLRNGKWAAKIKKVCRTAQYVVTDDPLVASKLGRQQVSKVPWKRALAHFRPQLVAGGYRVASQESAKKTLQLAFLRGPQVVAHVPKGKPVDVQASDRVTTAEAQEAFAKAPRQARQVISRDDTAKARKKVMGNLRRAAEAGLISKLDALHLSRSTANPVDIQRAASRIARINLAAKSGTYQGVGTRVSAVRQGRDAEMAKLAQAELGVAQVKKAQNSILKMVQAGQITLAEGRRSVAAGAPKKMLQVATAFANSSGTRKVRLASSDPAQEYAGAVQKAAAIYKTMSVQRLSSEEVAIQKAASASGIKIAEFTAMSSWLRRQMSEGMAGKDLTALLQLRFASPLRIASTSLIASLREAHEGLAGHLYVDAAAYASKKGIKGCEAGATQHRTNNVPLVKAMPRCAGCNFANTNGVCIKYGKELMHDLPADAGVFQKQMLAVADAPDHEITAALFDPGEFNLGNSMENLDVNDPTITEDIGGVFFGDGMIL